MILIAGRLTLISAASRSDHSFVEEDRILGQLNILNEIRKKCLQMRTLLQVWRNVVCEDVPACYSFRIVFIPCVVKYKTGCQSKIRKFRTSFYYFFTIWIYNSQSLFYGHSQQLWLPIERLSKILKRCNFFWIVAMVNCVKRRIYLFIYLLIIIFQNCNVLRHVNTGQAVSVTNRFVIKGIDIE